MFLFIICFLLAFEGVFCNDCPEQCFCNTPNSVFCIYRRSTTVPRVPISTQELFIFQNGIVTLTQDDFKDIVELVTLDLSQNRLAEIPDKAFESLSKLKNLDLSGNHITHISKNSFSGLVQLERLYLHGNLIQSIHREAFEGLEMLLELKLQDNKLTSLPSLNFPRLLLLDLSKNKIPPLEPSHLHTPHLEALKLSSLGLPSLHENLVASLRNLHELDLSMNQLNEVPQALKQESLKGLTKLSLAANPLFELRAGDFQQLVALQELDLSAVHLQGFPEGFFESFPKLAQLTIAENPFNCLCPLAWFPVWLKEKEVNLKRPEETRCHFPLVNAGKTLSALEHKDFGCPLTTTESIGSPVKNTPVPQIPITSSETTHSNAISPHPPPSDETFSSITDNPDLGSEPSVSPSSTVVENELHFCSQNICLNGGTCYFDPKGLLACLCSPETSGHYCENLSPEMLQPSGTEVSVVTSVMPDKHDAISSREVTSTSILLDLHRFIETRPNIRGIRLTYRNLSGPDRRPMILSLPTSYPEYTLRGLKSNCTYSVCASPLGEKITFKGNSTVERGSCTEARTTPTVSAGHLVDSETPMTKTFIAALVVLALVLVLALVAGTIISVQKKRQANAAMALELGPTHPEAMDLEGIKVCLQNGVNGTLPLKKLEADHCQTTQLPPLLQQNGSFDYDAPLMQGHCPSNNNQLVCA